MEVLDDSSYSSSSFSISTFFWPRPLLLIGQSAATLEKIQGFDWPLPSIQKNKQKTRNANLQFKVYATEETLSYCGVSIQSLFHTHTQEKLCVCVCLRCDSASRFSVFLFTRYFKKKNLNFVYVFMLLLRSFINIGQGGLTN